MHSWPQKIQPIGEDHKVETQSQISQSAGLKLKNSPTTEKQDEKLYHFDPIDHERIQK